ncbi:MAG: dimethyl sulfoxide reductase anchor subunit, partial [Verrucomicrobiae bacterium]|nr:dimethyl sulfoxide reductase anchor subunit [Verrucomicrobiae bacterium]
IGLLGSAGFQSTNLPVLVTGFLLFNAGMAAATFHLGQPLKAWRFFLGLRSSWLSREILAFSLFAPLPIALCALPFLPDFPFKSHFSLLTSYSALPAGVVAVFTSVMIYHDTKRALWRFPLSAIRFFGSVAAFAALAWHIEHHSPAAFTAVVLGKLAAELALLPRARDVDWSPHRHSARLMLGPLRRVLVSRVALAAAAVLAAPFQPWLALPLLLASEILERQLFFQAVQAPKMPGGFGPAGGVACPAGHRA